GDDADRAGRRVSRQAVRHVRLAVPRPGVPEGRSLVRRGPGLDERDLPEPAEGDRAVRAAWRGQAADGEDHVGAPLMTKTPMRVRVGVRSDIGRARKRNEDAFLVRDPLFAVADGMGGHRGGNVASSMSVEELEALDLPPEGALPALVEAVKN